MFRRIPAAIVMAIVLLSVASSVRAQDVGVRAGLSSDPDQFYFGAHLETRPVVDRLRFRPNVEVGLGNDLTVTTVNLEFVYPIPFVRSPWRVLPGAGPALVIASYNGGHHSGGGFNFLIGLEHRDGFFAELKVGAGDSPDLKFGVGYTWRQ
jgi:hypothetical protein